MSRVSLPRKAKTEPLIPRKSKLEPLFSQPVVIGEVFYKRVKRAAKKPRLSIGPSDDNDPNAVHVEDSDPQDTDFAPVSTGPHGTSKQRYRATPNL